MGTNRTAEQVEQGRKGRRSGMDRGRRWGGIWNLTWNLIHVCMDRNDFFSKAFIHIKQKFTDSNSKCLFVLICSYAWAYPFCSPSVLARKPSTQHELRAHAATQPHQHRRAARRCKGCAHANANINANQRFMLKLTYWAISQNTFFDWIEFVWLHAFCACYAYHIPRSIWAWEVGCECAPNLSFHTARCNAHHIHPSGVM